MRKQDTEWVEMMLEPLRTAKDRHNESINTVVRRLDDLATQVRDLERDRDSHSLTVEQAANSVRSLLQKAHRELRRVGALDEVDPDLDTPPVETHVRPEPGNVPVTAQGRRVI